LAQILSKLLYERSTRSIDKDKLISRLGDRFTNCESIACIEQEVSGAVWEFDHNNVPWGIGVALSGDGGEWLCNESHSWDVWIKVRSVELWKDKGLRWWFGHSSIPLKDCYFFLEWFNFIFELFELVRISRGGIIWGQSLLGLDRLGKKLGKALLLVSVVLEDRGEMFEWDKIVSLHLKVEDKVVDTDLAESFWDFAIH
jgi:ribosomal protein L31E